MYNKEKPLPIILFFVLFFVLFYFLGWLGQNIKGNLELLSKN